AGACHLALGHKKNGINLLETAVKRGSPDAALLLAEDAVKDYRVDDADGYLDEYDAIISKNRKLKPNQERLDEINSRLVRTRNMLDRVERIAVIDSINVPKADFFRYYRLSPEAGRLADKSALPARTPVGDPSIVYVPENEIELIWAAMDSSGVSVLMSADRLADGSMTEPGMLGDDLNDGGDANFPFMMPDGVTLYYASDGENSIGGYDIFMTRRDDDGFLQPQNIGMPYNSPYNDYMLAIDEVTGVGWWASDRNQIQDSVTIYIYIPNEIRSNYSSDDADVASLALLKSIAATQSIDADYASVRRRIASVEAASADTDSASSFRFHIPGKGVYTHLDQFRSVQARHLMEAYLSKVDEYARSANHLRLLRKAYADGNKGVAEEIRRLEKLLSGADADLIKASNAVIKAEK
ncbi:MAG: hypothetical protein K2O12_02970, partial [Muribaculaceae bacterium]|nr:hypothetical protein [Muribaculaceae bacterium]